MRSGASTDGLGTRAEVERVNGHRYEAHEIVCSRCGVLWEDAEVEPCMTSTVDVLPAEADE